jgi:hypothetical protein
MFSGHKAGGAIGESNLGSSLFRRYNCTRSRASSYATTAWRSYVNKDVEPPIRTLQLGLGADREVSCRLTVIEGYPCIRDPA